MTSTRAALLALAVIATAAAAHEPRPERTRLFPMSHAASAPGIGVGTSGAVHILYPSTEDVLRHAWRERGRWRDEALEDRWNRLLAVRAIVNQALESARQRKDIGSALAAHVTLHASGPDADLLQATLADLPMIFITSSVSLERRESGEVTVDVVRASGEKCPRCWRVVLDVAPIDDDPDASLCARCTDVIGGVVASR